jgi:hypothetical protein
MKIRAFESISGRSSLRIAKSAIEDQANWISSPAIGVGSLT